MPPEAPPVPAAIAAAPTPPPAPVSAPTPAPVPTPPPGDAPKLSGKLFALLQQADDSAPPEATVVKKPVKTGEKPPETPKSGEPAAPAAPTPPPEKPITVRRKAKAPAPIPGPIAAPPPAAPAPAPDAADEKKWESELLDEEREQLELARTAEQHGGKKYEGFTAKTAAFLKELQKRADAENFDENDPDFQKWFEANQPRVSALDREKIVARSEIAAQSGRKAPELEELQHELFVRDTEPKIIAAAADVKRKLNSTVFPKEITDAFETKVKELGGDQAKALKAVQEDYALEFDLAKNVVDVATSDVQEFRRLTTYSPKTGKPLKAYDEHNPAHQRIMRLMNDVCAGYRQDASAPQNRGDKWFATREEYYAMPVAERAKWWTLSNDEIIDRAMAAVPAVVALAIEQERDRLEKRYRFTRTRAAAAAAPTAPVTPTPTPPPRPSALPSGAPGGAAPSMGSALAGKLGTGE